MISEPPEAMREESPNEQVTLRVGLESSPAVLIDRSASRLSICTDKHPGVYVGEAVWVETSTGWVEARITNVVNEARGIRLDLERIVKPDKQASVDEDAPEPRTDPAWIRRSMLAGGLLAGLVLPFISFGSNPKPPIVDSIQQVVRRFDDTPPLQWASQPDLQKLYEPVSKLGPMSLAVPEVSEALELTSIQQQEVLDILNRTMRLQQSLQKMQPANQHAVEQLIVHAQRQFLKLLTKSQRQRFTALMTKSTSHGKPTDPTRFLF